VIAGFLGCYEVYELAVLRELFRLAREQGLI
jgi:hypothetical protein